MKNKKFFAVLLCAAMVATSLTACDNKPSDEDISAVLTQAPAILTQAAQPTEAPKATEAPKPTEAPKSEAVPEAKYYYSFDQAAGSKGIQVTKQELGGTPILSEAEGKEITYIPGVKGDCVYTDGVTGYKLTDVNGVGETYTVAFWLYATRFANYMPTVQFGPDVHGDVTGAQHYMNITRASWGDGPTFPCVWSYDQARDGLWPNWFPEETNEHLKEWMHIAIVVDPTITSPDGAKIIAKLYVNGALYCEEVPVVTGAMEASDNFDFLLGVNYWDKVFKGGFDELYIFDQPLTAGQVSTLYAEGNPKAQFNEPEHIFKVTPNENAKEVIGNIEFTNGEFGKEFLSPVTIADGDKMQIKLTNWSDGNDSKNNYAMFFTEGTSEDPMKDAKAKVYADADGDGSFNYTWGNWKTWSQKVMRDADVTLTIERTGSELTIKAENVDYNESVNTMYATVDTKIDADKDVVLYITCKNSYVELLSVKSLIVKSTGKVVGATDCSQGFWQVFSDIYSVPVNSARTVRFKNYTNGAASWNNFVAILQSTPTGHSAETEGYKEYAVLRADNWGWGLNFDNADTSKETTADWATFAQDMDGADVVFTVLNNNGAIDIVATYTTTEGKVITQKYTNITADGDVYLTFTLEGAYLVFENAVTGATDCSQGFWQVFTDIWAVPEGSTTVTFDNYTNGAASWNNFVAILQSTPTGHSAETEGYKEYAVLRADNWGWGLTFDNADTSKETNADWATFAQDMDGARVVFTVTKANGMASVVATYTTKSGKVITQKYTNIAVDGDLYLTFTLEGAYIVMQPTIVGATDLTQGFWQVFTDIWAVPANGSKTVRFKNYTNGAAGWNNFVAILQSTPTGHSAETEGYKEYAVLRADNWGWGLNFDNADTSKETNADWATFAQDMDGADVVFTVNNNNGAIDIVATYTTTEGKVITQKYTNITADGDVYLTFTLEGAYLVFEDGMN